MKDPVRLILSQELGTTDSRVINISYPSICYTIGLPGVAIVRRLGDSDTILLAFERSVCTDESPVCQSVRSWIGAS